MKIWHEKEFSTYCDAKKALQIARRVVPEKYSYVTNEKGNYSVVVHI